MEKEDFLKYICQSTRVLFILENNVLKKKEHSNFFLIFYNIDSDLKKLNGTYIVEMKYILPSYFQKIHNIYLFHFRGEKSLIFLDHQS